MTAVRTARFSPLRCFFSADFGVGGGVRSLSSNGESSETESCCVKSVCNSVAVLFQGEDSDSTELFASSIFRFLAGLIVEKEDERANDMSGIDLKTSSTLREYT